MPRFVILSHDHPFLHWDLMLEPSKEGERSGLRTWRLLTEPAPNVEIEAEALDDHRVEYLDYEGPVSGHRGTVKRWDAGEYQIHSESDDSIRFQVTGNRLNGDTVITATINNRWIFRIQQSNERFRNCD